MEPERTALTRTGVDRRPKARINIGISHSGSEVQYTKNYVLWDPYAYVVFYTETIFSFHVSLPECTPRQLCPGLDFHAAPKGLTLGFRTDAQQANKP